jgi:tRNA threonylcarbamoyladenosine biosynthesis protein TsaE
VNGSFLTGSPARTRDAGRALAGLLEPGDVVALTGDLGAGKTAFVQGVAEGLGVTGPVVSPTFNILVDHPGRLTLHHFDLYRLEHADQLEDVDYFGTLEADGVSFIEWGDRFPQAVPPESLVVEIDIVSPEERRFAVDGRGERGATLARLWLDAVGATEASP